MVTFITTKEVGESFYCSVQTLDGYWKMYHNDSYSTVFNDGEEGITISNPNREVTIIPCLSDGTPRPSSNILVLGHNIELESFNGTGLSGLTNLNLSDCGLTEFDGTPLTSLTLLTLNNNQLTTLDISNMDYLQELYVQDNLLTPSVNNSLLVKLAANELVNNWDTGVFNTTGERTSVGTTDYNYLIANGWLVEGADLPSTWYRFKAPSTESWDGVIGVDANQNVKEIWLYQSNGFTYYDFLTSQSIGEVKFNVQGTETEIIATQVPVTLQEFSSSGSFTAAIGFEGNAIGYANTVVLGSWGTLNSGTIPAIPSRYEGDLPSGSIVFSDVVLQEGNFCLISAPILMSLTVNGYSINLTGVNGSPTGTTISPLGFGNGNEVTFSITWGELVETPVSRKLRVKGVGQINP